MFFFFFSLSRVKQKDSLFFSVRLLLLSLTRDICICVTNGQLARQIQKNRGKKKFPLLPKQGSEEWEEQNK
jgi:hypothetical protein